MSDELANVLKLVNIALGGRDVEGDWWLRLEACDNHKEDKKRKREEYEEHLVDLTVSEFMQTTKQWSNFDVVNKVETLKSSLTIRKLPVRMVKHLDVDSYLHDYDLTCDYDIKQGSVTPRGQSEATLAQADCEPCIISKDELLEFSS